MAEKLLEVKGVSKIFRIGGMLSRKKLTAIDDVSLTITNERPVILSIVGESGCGKSTLCKMILRVHKPDMGEIFLNGKPYSDRRAYDPLQFRLDVQPIFQNPYESFSARKTVDTYLFNTALRLGICKTRKEAEERIDEVLKSVGLSLAVVKGKYPTQFSGGELQRFCIARALATHPRYLICDEVSTMLDAVTQAHIWRVLLDYAEREGAGMLLVSHTPALTERVATRKVKLSRSES